MVWVTFSALLRQSQPMHSLFHWLTFHRSILILLQHLPPLSLKEPVCLRQNGYLQLHSANYKRYSLAHGLLDHSRSPNACINLKDVCWIVKPAGIISTSTARCKILPFPCFTLTEIHELISAFVAC